jgi:hypothetical protein
MLPDSMVCSHSGPLINQPLLFGWCLGLSAICIIIPNAIAFLVWDRFFRSELNSGSEIKESRKIGFLHLFDGNEILIADIDGPVVLFLGAAELTFVHMGIWCCAVICPFEFPRLLLSNVTDVVGNSHGESPSLHRARDL